MELTGDHLLTTPEQSIKISENNNQISRDARDISSALADMQHSRQAGQQSFKTSHLSGTQAEAGGYADDLTLVRFRLAVEGADLARDMDDVAARSAAAYAAKPGIWMEKSTRLWRPMITMPASPITA